MEQIAVRYPVLYGEHELVIDEKNRLLVPSDVRKRFGPEDGAGFFIKIGPNKVPWFYPEKYYEFLGMQAPTVITPDQNAQMRDQLHFALASKVDWDKQGRVVIPERILTKTNVGKDVTLVGCRDHLELWNRLAWEERREALLNSQM